jgi:hypothetical protein
VWGRGRSGDASAEPNYAVLGYSDEQSVSTVCEERYRTADGEKCNDDAVGVIIPRPEWE